MAQLTSDRAGQAFECPTRAETPLRTCAPSTCAGGGAMDCSYPGEASDGSGLTPRRWLPQFASRSNQTAPTSRTATGRAGQTGAMSDIRSFLTGHLATSAAHALGSAGRGRLPAESRAALWPSDLCLARVLRPGLPEPARKARRAGASACRPNQVAAVAS